MVRGNRRNSRCRNVAVNLSLPEFASKFAELFGVRAQFTGPGPLEVFRGDCLPDRPIPFAVKYLFDELFSKFDDGVGGHEKWTNCLSRFDEAERLCRETNRRFQEDRDFLYQGTTSSGFSVGSAMWRAQRKIAWLLGSYDDSKVKPYMGFGPGATSRLPRSRADLAYKMGGIPQATLAATPFVRDILADYPLWVRYLRLEGSAVEIVGGNKVVSVPKDYQKDRMIAIEPDWNMHLQKGFGGYIRRVLRKVGVDLDDQSNNAFCAGLGSLYGDLATIDLKMASDCMSYELVRFMLPCDWFDALEQCRSPMGVLTPPSFKGVRREPTRLVVYEKFSSMGNGATFELESLIFWALCSAVIELMQLSDRRLLVYGDDLVVPVAAFDNVVMTLNSAGFIPNAKKSFSTGPFRESCGSHFYEGSDVTPIYVREPVNRLDRLFLLHNNCARLLQRYEPWVEALPGEVLSFFEWLRSHAPDEWTKPRLPRLDVGDGAFYGCFELSQPKRATRGWEGWRVRTLQERRKSGAELESGANPLLAGLWKLGERNDAEAMNRLGFLRSIGGQRQSVPVDVLRKHALSVQAQNPLRRRRLDSDRAKVGAEYRVSTQIVVSLATDYCWWEVLL